MVYILSISPALAGRARFYVGYCGLEGFEKRFERHLAGDGAKIIRAAIQQGHSVTPFALLPDGTRQDERAIKRLKNTGLLVEKILAGKRPDWVLYRP